VKVQFWVLVTTILVLGLLAGATESCDSTSQSGAQTTGAQAAPTVTNRLLERPVLGSTDSTFVSEYGQPIAHKTNSSGDAYKTFATGNSDIATFDVYLEPGTNLVYGIEINALVDKPWDVASGMALCNFYLPSDTVMGKPKIITEADGVKLYYREGNSAALAASVDSSYFFDGGNHQLVKPGTINASYYYADTQGFTISLCNLLFGTTADE
jgi:hypothetical protein